MPSAAEYSTRDFGNSNRRAIKYCRGPSRSTRDKGSSVITICSHVDARRRSAVSTQFPIVSADSPNKMSLPISVISPDVGTRGRAASSFHNSHCRMLGNPRIRTRLGLPKLLPCPMAANKSRGSSHRLWLACRMDAIPRAALLAPSMRIRRWGRHMAGGELRAGNSGEVTTGDNHPARHPAAEGP